MVVISSWTGGFETVVLVAGAAIVVVVLAVTSTATDTTKAMAAMMAVTTQGQRGGRSRSFPPAPSRAGNCRSRESVSAGTYGAMVTCSDSGAEYACKPRLRTPGGSSRRRLLRFLEGRFRRPRPPQTGGNRFVGFSPLIAASSPSRLLHCCRITRRELPGRGRQRNGRTDDTEIAPCL